LSTPGGKVWFNLSFNQWRISS